jgi:hypothetical protein
VGQFSDDGLWWWDGTTWIATAQIVLPQLPMTEFEQSGKLKGARSFMRRFSVVIWGNTSINVALVFLFPWLAALRDYRSWRLEQLALATGYLLGPHEAMLAGETSLFDSRIDRPFVPRDLAVAVTAAHVLVFVIDSLDGQPRRVALAGRPTDVKLRLRPFFGLYPSFLITCGNGQWRIQGIPSVFKPEPVLEAWRQATTIIV